MQRDATYIRDIIESAKLAVSYVAVAEEEAFLATPQLQDAVIRRLEIIGEAARRVSEETRLAHADIPWRQMIGMRNQVIHMYDGVDLDAVWNTVRHDLPALLEALRPLAETEEG